jgi:hypothetical protein
VHLLTQPRCWGLSFNPVSFYFCHDRDGQLAAILLEVRNTPWRERFHYVLPVQPGLPRQFCVAKAFHVSPFMPLDMEYRLRFFLDAQRVRIHMENWRRTAGVRRRPGPGAPGAGPHHLAPAPAGLPMDEPAHAVGHLLASPAPVVQAHAHSRPPRKRNLASAKPPARSPCMPEPTLSVSKSAGLHRCSAAWQNAVLAQLRRVAGQLR